MALVFPLVNKIGKVQTRALMSPPFAIDPKPSTPADPPEPVFTPEAFFSGAEFGDWWDFRDASSLYKDDLQEQPVTTIGDLVQSAPGKRGVITLSSGLKPKWDGTENGLSSQFITVANLEAGFASRDWPSALTLVVIGDRSSGTTGGPDSMLGIGSVLDNMYGSGAGTIVSMQMRPGGNIRAVYKNRNNDFAYSAEKSDTPQMVALVSRSGATNGTGYEVSASGGTDITLAPGALTRFDRLFARVESSGGNFTYMRGALLIERELTPAELNQLAAYFGLPADILDEGDDEIPVDDNQFSYRLNASEQLIQAFDPSYEKLIPSTDEQTGTLELAFSGSDRTGLMTGKLTSEDPIVPDPLHDMSYGTGDFVYEIHASFPSVSGPLAVTYLTNVVLLGSNTEEVVFYTVNGIGGGLSVAPENISTLSFWDDDENEVKMVSYWLDGEYIGDTEISGDLSAPVVRMSISEPSGSVGDQASFDDENPSISVRFVTDPAEMIYATSVLPRPAKTVVGDGEVIPAGPYPAALFESGTYKGFMFDPRVPANLAQLSDGTVAVGSGDPVGYLTDLSGSGNHARQSVSGSRGTFPGISLDGADDNYWVLQGVSGGHDFANIGYAVSGAYSGFFKVRPDNADAMASFASTMMSVGCTVACFRTTGGAGAKVPFVIGFNNGRFVGGAGATSSGGGDLRLDGGAISNGQTYTIGFVIEPDVDNDGTLTLYLNGVAVASDTGAWYQATSLQNASAYLSLGSRVTDAGAAINRLQGDLGPSLFINKKLTAKDFEDLHEWAMS